MELGLELSESSVLLYINQGDFWEVREGEARALRPGTIPPNDMDCHNIGRDWWGILHFKTSTRKERVKSGY